ncbi:enoyl-CoA hydratase [Microbacteriaceae bacterium SG_E_30_P1]|uniref:3-hydroxyisobutyryl-CoA hydrolase n=1 Tax=Antiquaquibacter oligotrophicus TaxID=2880260 RepID=A0ABT6KNC3_9MICO|nr:enoyl-CoA hydratase/isomerase family protein [Antiquaquibacter oligotrophicus]MDH6181501.1 enoyl-CoA hydratase [Antiquaquibacter oligotrophicus]UDF12809.1 enoyl-CoA hydratase/isomerase family protein [Antiquaquibacter oligotrophicus]
MDDAAATTDVRFAVTGALGTITLDRPRALNAFNHGMVTAITRQLVVWRDDPAVERVLIESTGDRAFCAGGDIVPIYRDALIRRNGESGGDGTEQFWRDEYALNSLMAHYPKPIVTFMAGLVLGGGVGLGSHASHRIVTETSKVGMPEVTIGFVPDVGGTWLLSHAPGELGTRMALTGESVGAASAIHVGLADYFVPSERLRGLREALSTRAPDDAIADVVADAGHPAITDDQALLDACFAHNDVGDILAALRAADRSDLADVIESKSPTALVLTLESLRRARTLGGLDAALIQEFRVAMACLDLPDLAEGIRAQVIDKDRSPRWRPSAVAEVDRAVIDAAFAPRRHDLHVPTREEAP